VSTRSLRPLVAVSGAALLCLSLVGSAVAQEEASPSPAPSPDIEAATLELRLERRTERKAAREERKADRTAAKAVRKADRDERRAERRTDRAATREERRADRAAKKQAWSEVKDACVAELKAARSDEELDRAQRREAIREAKADCKELYLAAKSKASSDGAAIDGLYTKAASDGTGVVRTDLGIAEPGSAPGEDLGLWHYLIPAQTELAPHTHPGWQLARITDGELEYTVLEGEGVLLRADGSSEPMGPGTYVLATGDGVIENPTLVHLGANRTDEPVTIISATLFEDGEPISTLVEEDVAAE